MKEKEIIIDNDQFLVLMDEIYNQAQYLADLDEELIVPNVRKIVKKIIKKFNLKNLGTLPRDKFYEAYTFVNSLEEI